jgi:hypothetical protein
MSDLNQKREIAQSEGRDKTAKIISSFVPGGTAAYELLTTLVVPLHEKKKREFINDLAVRLKRLEEQGKIDFEELAKNKEFNTIITKAILLAQQYHQRKKLEALRNMVVYAAKKLPKGVLEFDLTDYFLSIIDRISPIHIVLLNTFHDPDKVIAERKVDLSKIISSSQKKVFLRIYPELTEKTDLVDLSWKELHSFGLVSNNSLKDLSSVGGNLNQLTTKLGDQFLEMIESEE